MEIDQNYGHNIHNYYLLAILVYNNNCDNVVCEGLKSQQKIITG